ncbi:MAG TPA: lasso RiPP family leader peptide-containing protein [Mycobacteriales bacterium]|nr:lasso RiPP family leader peptide-containing protein [Mycobacteriales bacterium]
MHTVEPTEEYEPPVIVDLGALADLVLGNPNGPVSDLVFPVPLQTSG